MDTGIIFRISSLLGDTESGYSAHTDSPKSALVEVCTVRMHCLSASSSNCHRRNHDSYLGDRTPNLQLPRLLYQLCWSPNCRDPIASRRLTNIHIYSTRYSN